jgi:cardiolipin synthase A/B
LRLWAPDPYDIDSTYTIDDPQFYWSGSIRAEFARALAARARAGVKVHVIIDAVGGDKMDDEYVVEMQNAGVEVELYRPLHWYKITAADKLNYRTHRKLLIVDGRTGFTGGVGIADEWRGNADSPGAGVEINEYQPTCFTRRS